MRRLTVLWLLLLAATAAPAAARPVRIVEITSGTTRTILTDRERFVSYEHPVLTEDGTGLLVVRNGDEVVRIDLTTGSRLTFNPVRGADVAVGPGGVVAVRTQGRLARIVFRELDGTRRATSNRIRVGRGYADGDAFSRDGSRFATLLPVDKRRDRLVVYDTATGDLLAERLVDDLSTLGDDAFDATGDLVVFEAGERLRAFDVKRGRVRPVLGGNLDLLIGGRFAPTGTTLVGYGYDDHLLFGPPSRRSEGFGRGLPTAVAWAPDGGSVYLGAGPIDPAKATSRILQVPLTGAPQLLADVGHIGVEAILPTATGLVAILTPDAAL